MVIKALAVELYRAQQRVHRLRDELEAASLQQRDQLRQELLTAEAECRQLRRLVDAKKAPSPFRTNFKNR